MEIGRKEIALNEPFTITISIENAKFKQLSPFPDLKGFTKHGRYTESSTNIDANGVTTTLQSITQSYYAKKEGIHEIKSFSININDEILKSGDFTITVNPAKQGTSITDLLVDPDDPFFKGEEEVDIEGVEGDVFLAVSTNKDEVYAGEDFNMTLALYVANNTRRSLQFIEISQQLNDILKKLKPANCWEEDFNIDRLYPLEVRINNRSYIQYKLYQASFFAFNENQINIPSVTIKMVDNNYPKEKEDKYYVEFSSVPKSILVKPLPPHPLKDKVLVGKFYIDEKASVQEVKTGESFTYNIAIVGDGNITNINTPETNENEELDFYPPTIRQVVKRINNRVTGAKVFGHYVVPKSPGTYPLKNYFQFIYFDLTKQQYDTLYPKTTITITGEKLKDRAINQFGDYYSRLEHESNTLKPINDTDNIKLGANIFMLVLLLVTLIWIIISKRIKS